jgi:hypothetical protein
MHTMKLPPGVRIEVASPWEGLCEEGASPSWGLMGAGAAGKESVGRLEGSPGGRGMRALGLSARRRA